MLLTIKTICRFKWNETENINKFRPQLVICFVLPIFSQLKRQLTYMRIFWEVVAIEKQEHFTKINRNFDFLIFSTIFVNSF